MSEVYYCPKCDLRLYWSQVINQLNTEVKCPKCGSFEIYSEQQIMSGNNNILGMGQQGSSYDYERMIGLGQTVTYSSYPAPTYPNLVDPAPKFNEQLAQQYQYLLEQINLYTGPIQVPKPPQPKEEVAIPARRKIRVED